MRRFDYSFLDNVLLPANLINITGVMKEYDIDIKIHIEEFEVM